MFGGMHESKWNNELSEDEREKISGIIREIGKLITEQAKTRGLSPVAVNGTTPSNTIAVLDSVALHVVFERIASGSTTGLLFGARDQKLNINDVAQHGVHELGMKYPSGISIPRQVLIVDDATRDVELRKIVNKIVSDMEVQLNKPRAVPGFEHMQDVLDRFSDDHPDFDRNVFIAMRFAPTPQNNEI